MKKASPYVDVVWRYIRLFCACRYKNNVIMYFIILLFA